jgi:hypothetical protein
MDRTDPRQIIDNSSVSSVEDPPYGYFDVITKLYTYVRIAIEHNEEPFGISAGKGK